MRTKPSEVDEWILREMADEGVEISPFQLERWRQVGLLPRNRRWREGRVVVSDLPSMPNTDLGALLRFLAAVSTRGRPWQHVGMALLWADCSVDPDPDLSFAPLKRDEAAFEPHFMLSDNTLQELASYAFAQPRRAIARALNAAKSGVSSRAMPADDELERVLGDAGSRFRRTPIGRAFLRDRQRELEAIHNLGLAPSTHGEGGAMDQRRRRLPRTDDELRDLATISMDWMMADAEMKELFKRRHRNLALFGQAQRPRHWSRDARLPLYSDLDRCSVTITHDEVYELAHVWAAEQSDVHAAGWLAYMRSIVWWVTVCRLEWWTDLRLEEAAVRPLPIDYFDN